MRITPLDPVKGRFMLTRAAEQLAKAQKARRKGVAEARRNLIRTQARFLAHDLRQAKATAPRLAPAELDLFGEPA